MAVRRERETINHFLLVTHDSLLVTYFFFCFQYFVGQDISLSGEPALAAEPVKPALPVEAGQIASRTFRRSGRRRQNLSAVTELTDIAWSTIRATKQK